jgi:CheY-like chemotaxis protein
MEKQSSRRFSLALKRFLFGEDTTLEVSYYETQYQEPESLRVLVVDHNKAARDATAKLLHALGCVVVTSQDGASAFMRALQFQPQVVVVDLVMPNMSGYTLVEEIRADPFLSDTLLISVTDLDEDSEGWLSKLAGCDYHFVKPLDPFMLECLLCADSPSDSYEVW